MSRASSTEGPATYNCIECNRALRGPFGAHVHCSGCRITFHTDYELHHEGIYCWIVRPARPDEICDADFLGPRMKRHE